jgi:hypothetical protein
MRSFILLMHQDMHLAPQPELWVAYFASLRERGVFDGGSAIGAGETFRKSGVPGPISEALSGYIRIRAADMAQARACLAGNPVFEGGGTVEIRALPRD